MVPDAAGRRPQTSPRGENNRLIVGYITVGHVTVLCALSVFAADQVVLILSRMSFATEQSRGEGAS